MRRLKEVMKVLKKILATLLALSVLSLSAFALDVQRQNEQPKPPPKEQKEVPKQEKPPPPREDNNNRDRGGNDNKRGKP